MGQERPTPADQWEEAASWSDQFDLLFPDGNRLKSDGAQRKARLATCAVARIGWPFLSNEHLFRAVETAERLADGDAKPSELISAGTAANRVARELERPAEAGRTRMYRSRLTEYQRTGVFVPLLRVDITTVAVPCRASDAARATVRTTEACLDRDSLWNAFDSAPLIVLPLERLAGMYVGEPGYRPDDIDDNVAPLLRCIFGNPFRPVKLAAKHRTPTVVGLADAMTADGAFDHLPILADALEEAGCDDADILGHARGPGPHVRGCWVVDLVRGVHWQPRRK